MKRRIDGELFEKIAGRVKSASEGAIRTAISRIAALHPGLTANAAASIFAQKNGFSVIRYLQENDRDSLAKLSPSYASQFTFVKNRSRSVGSKLTTPSFGGKYLAGAMRNARVYPYSYILENMLRDLIEERLSVTPDWWVALVPSDVQASAIRTQNAEKTSPWVPARGSRNLDYVGFYELFKIIEKNYNPHFKDVFDLQMLRTWMKESEPVRHLIAHHAPLPHEETSNMMNRAKLVWNCIENATAKRKSHP